MWNKNYCFFLKLLFFPELVDSSAYVESGKGHKGGGHKGVGNKGIGQMGATFIKGWARGRTTQRQSVPKLYFNFGYCYLNFELIVTKITKHSELSNISNA